MRTNTLQQAKPSVLLPTFVRRHFVAPALALAIASATASAQFPGDVYFSEPTPTFETGTTVKLTVMTFTGTQPFGGVTLDLIYDPAQFRVDSIVPLGGSGVGLHATNVTTTLGTAAALYNGESLSSPFGAIALFEVTGEPLFVGPGSFSIDLQVRNLIDPAGSEFPQSSGFGAVVTILDAAAGAETWPSAETHGAEQAIHASLPDVYMPLQALTYPWRGLSRPGSALLIPMGPNPGRRIWVRTYDPRARADD